MAKGVARFGAVDDWSSRATAGVPANRWTAYLRQPVRRAHPRASSPPRRTRGGAASADSAPRRQAGAHRAEPSYSPSTRRV